jgi:hypothetical protein
METLKLYGVPASHPTDAVEAALRLKGLPYKRRDFLPVLHKAIMASGCSARARSCASSTSCNPSRRCSPPTRRLARV